MADAGTQVAEEVALSMKRAFNRAHRQMLQSLADERQKQHERLQRKLHRSRTKRLAAKANELGRDFAKDEKNEVEATLQAIYQREVVKLDDSFDEEELRAILKYGWLADMKA